MSQRRDNSKPAHDYRGTSEIRGLDWRSWAVRGTNCLHDTDKQSKEKVDLLKALARSNRVPDGSRADDPRIYYSVAKKLAKELPNSFTRIITRMR